MRVLSDGKVRRNREEWERIFKRYEKSGLSEATFCEREEISQSSFYNWKRKLWDAGTGSHAFVELTASEPIKPSAMPSGEFELSLPGGVLLRWKA